MPNKKKGGIQMSYIRSMIECLESNRMLLQEELEHLEHYPELTGTVITKLVRCSRPNCAACAAGYFHGPNAYYQYYEDGQLKEKYLGKRSGRSISGKQKPTKNTTRSPRKSGRWKRRSRSWRRCSRKKAGKRDEAGGTMVPHQAEGRDERAGL